MEEAAEAIARVQAAGRRSIEDDEEAVALDQADPLARFRDAFVLPAGSIYLCGNSLGPMPRATPSHIERVLSRWGREGVLGWFSSSSPEEGASFKDAEKGPLEDLAMLLGACGTEEVVAMNALTVNLILMLAAFYRPTQTRFKIIVEEGAFPSDMHAIHSHLATRGIARDAVLVLPRRPGEATWRPADVLAFIQEHAATTSLVFLSGLHYATGQLFDMEAIARVAHDNDCLVGFDLAHAVGNVELRLHDWGVDFAVFCTYKYLSSGPGSVGGAFIHAKHTQTQDGGPARLQGWWGQREQDRFSFAEPAFSPAPGALGFQLSTPSPMQLAALEASLAIFKDAGGMRPVRAKSVLLTAYLQSLLEAKLGGRVQIITPRDPSQRGSQLSLTFVEVDADQVLRALQARNVIADVRKPNIIRVAPFPLYTSFLDVLRFVRALHATA